MNEQGMAEIVGPMFFIVGVCVVMIMLMIFRYRKQQLDHKEAMCSLELRLPLPPRPVSRSGNVYSMPLGLIGLGLGIGLLVVLNGEIAGYGIMGLMSLPGVGLLIAIRLNKDRFAEELERARLESIAYREAMSGAMLKRVK